MPGRGGRGISRTSDSPTTGLTRAAWWESNSRTRPHWTVTLKRSETTHALIFRVLVNKLRCRRQRNTRQLEKRRVSSKIMAKETSPGRPEQNQEDPEWRIACDVQGRSRGRGEVGHTCVCSVRVKRRWKGTLDPGGVVNLPLGRAEGGVAGAMGRNRISPWLAFYRILTSSHVNIFPCQENKLEI